MSQPCNRNGEVLPPGEVDASLGEFWVNNPWQIAAAGHNLSAFERDRTYLNLGGGRFVEVSHLSGADSDGDSRSAVAADFRGTGQLDLVVRQAGGWPLLLYENRLPKRNHLTVTLRGRASNRQGIGARLTAEVGSRSLVREVFGACGFRSQAPNVAHFGLGDAAGVDKLTVRWPSGKVQVLTGVGGGRHVVIDEGGDGPAAVRTVTPGKPIGP